MYAISANGLLNAGKPLVMLAGQGATARVWTPDLLRGLAQARQVYTPDNMGIGLSSKSDSDYSLEAFAQSTLDFLEALGQEQPDGDCHADHPQLPSGLQPHGHYGEPARRAAPG